MSVAFMFPLLLINAHGGCLFPRTSVNQGMRMTDRRWKSGRERRGSGRGRQTEIARGDEEIKFHLTLKNLLYKTNYFSKESFHHCMAAGPRAVTWLRVRLFVFIMWHAAMNARDDLFFLLCLRPPLTQLICKYEVIVTLWWRFELK